MIKTTYQTPELRDANDNVVQEGAFGKNSPLTNATNDGAFDYILNNLEALHDTIGDSSPTLDGNGHVVEPANLAIGDEDGLRIKNNYLKLSGGNVTGITSFRTDLRMLDNQDNRFGGLYVPSTTATKQYMQLYGGTRATGDARLTLYPSGDGHFSLLAYSNNGSNSYELRSDNAGNLNWRGYPLAWKKDYLPLAGGTMTGNIRNNSSGFVIGNVTSNNDGLIEIRSAYSSFRDGALLTLRAKNNTTGAGGFSLQTADGTTNISLDGKPDGTLTWGGNNIALAKDYLPLSGGTMTGNINYGEKVAQFSKYNNISSMYIVGSSTDSGIGILSKRSSFNDSFLILSSGDQSTNPRFRLSAGNGTTSKELVGKPDGTLTWGGKNIERIESSGTNYIRYTNGLQICWRSGKNFDTNGTQIVLPVPFKDATYAVNVTGRGLTTSTNIALLKVTTKDSAGFVAMAVASSNISSFSGGTLDYIAIGLWK